MTAPSTPAARTASTVRAETRPSQTEHYALTWRGIEVAIVYQRDWTGLPDCSYDHLEVMSVVPCQPLPMTETGYKSAFVPAGSIDQLGGPLAYVTRWLDHAAKSAAWKAIERDTRQGSLF